MTNQSCARVLGNCSDNVIGHTLSENVTRPTYRVTTILKNILNRCSHVFVKVEIHSFRQP